MQRNFSEYKIYLVLPWAEAKQDNIVNEKIVSKKEKRRLDDTAKFPFKVRPSCN